MTDARAFLEARDFLFARSAGLRRGVSRLPLAAARAVQLGARPLRRRWPPATTAGAVDRRGGRPRGAALLRASWRARSNRVANWLRGLGVAARRPRAADARRTSVALWESMLAAMKLGAVVVPATTLLAPVGPRATASSAARSATSLPARRTREKFARLRRRLHAHRRGRGGAGLAVVRRGAARPGANSRRTAPTRATDPLLLYFTSGHHVEAEAGPAQPPELPRRPPVDDVLDRPQARRRAPQHLLAGLGQARLELLLRALERRSVRLHLQHRALQRPGAARRRCRHTRSRRCARRRRSGGCSSRRTSTAFRVAPARSPRRRRALEPGGHRTGAQAAWGITMRDGYGQTETTLSDRQQPGPADQAGQHGPAAAGLSRRAARRRRPAGATRARSCLSLDAAAARPDGRLRATMPRTQRRRHARRPLPHGRRRAARRRRLHHLRRPRRRCLQGVRLPHQPVRARDRC